MTIYTAGVTRMMKRKLIILTEIESDKLLNMMRLLMIAALFLLTQQVKAQQADAKMNSFITSLMNRMTLEEKTGAAQPSQFR